MWWMERGTPEEGGIGPGLDAVVDAVEVLWVDRESEIVECCTTARKSQHQQDHQTAHVGLDRKSVV